MKNFMPKTGIACVLIGFIVFPTLVSASTIPTIAWTHTTSTAGTSSGTSVAKDEFGNVYVSGSTNGNVFGVPAGAVKDYLAKYDSNGSLEWQNVWASSYVGITGAAVDANGNIYAAAGISVKKFSSSGSLLWDSTFDSAYFTYCGAIALDLNGNAYITGTTYNPTQDTYVSKIDPSGKLLWKTSLHTAGSSYSNSIAVDASGNAVIAGTSYTDLSNRGFVTKFDSSGNIVWNEQFSTPTGSVAIDSQGATYLTVNSSLIKYDSVNQQQWVRGFSPHYMMSIALDPHGIEYVNGGSGILQFDSAGNLLNSYVWDNDDLSLAYGNGRLSISSSKFIPPNYLIDSYVSNIVVPEPSTFALLLTASLGGLLWWRRRS